MSKFDKKIIITLIFGAVGVVSLFIGISNLISRSVGELSQKISTGLDLLPSCGFSEEKTLQIKGVLLEALKQLHVENHYDSANSLYKSVSPDLWTCKPLLQAEPNLMLMTLAILIIIFCISEIRRTFL